MGKCPIREASGTLQHRPFKGAMAALAAGMLLLLLCLLGGQSWAQEDTDAQRCLEKLDSSPQTAIQHCTAAILSGQFSEAIVAAAYDNRGNAFVQLKDYDHAIQDFDEALGLDPDDTQAYDDRGSYYSFKGDYARAIQDFDQLIRLDPDNAQAYDERGNAFGSEGNFDRAIQDFNEAIRLTPDYAIAYYNRGAAYSRKKELDSAIQNFDEAIRLNSDYALAFYNRGNAYSDKQEYIRAIQDYDQAIRLQPRDPRFLRARGILEFCLGKFRSALPDETIAYQVDPTDPYSAIWLYLVQAKTGQDAKKHLATNSSGLDLNEWPGPLIQMFLGKATEAAVISFPAEKKQDDSAGQECEANFFLGEHALLRGNRTEAKRRFEAAVGTGVTTYYEYIASGTELALLQARP